jgi:hypothetical protein
MSVQSFGSFVGQEIDQQWNFITTFAQWRQGYLNDAETVVQALTKAAGLAHFQ